MHAFERDARGGIVGSGKGVLQSRAARGYAEDAASCCEQLTILDGGAGVEDLHIFEAAGFFDPTNGETGAIGAGVAAGCQGDTYSVTGMPQGIDFHGEGFRESQDRKSTRLNSSHLVISYAVF